jgi:hypothetical protein
MRLPALCTPGMSTLFGELLYVSQWLLWSVGLLREKTWAERLWEYGWQKRMGFQ